MTLVAKLVSETATCTLISSSSLGISAEQKYVVIDDGSAAVTIATAYAAVTAAVGSSTYTLNSVAGLCSSKSAALIADSANRACEVTVQYSSQQVTDATFLQYSASVGGTFIDVWRRGANYNGGTATTSDIGGTKVDSQGEPVSIFLTQATINKVRRYTTIPWSTIWGTVGNRNNALYEGATAGKLLFKGVSVSTVAAGVYEVSYELMSDNDFHMRQIPTREADGKIKRDTDGKAIEVKLIQPFPTTSDFAALIG